LAPSIAHNPGFWTLHFLLEDEGRGIANPLGGIGRDHPGGGGENGGEGTIFYHKYRLVFVIHF